MSLLFPRCNGYCSVLAQYVKNRFQRLLIIGYQHDGKVHKDMRKWICWKSQILRSVSSPQEVLLGHPLYMILYGCPSEDVHGAIRLHSSWPQNSRSQWCPTKYRLPGIGSLSTLLPRLFHMHYPEQHIRCLCGKGLVRLSALHRLRRGALPHPDAQSKWKVRQEKRR